MGDAYSFFFFLVIAAPTSYLKQFMCTYQVSVLDFSFCSLGRDDNKPVRVGGNGAAGHVRRYV